MNKLIYVLLKMNNADVEPYDVIGMTSNIYDQVRDTVFVFDGNTEPYKNCGHVFLIHAEDDAPDIRYYNYYPETRSIEEAINILRIAGYKITQRPVSLELTDDMYVSAISECDQKYIDAIIRYMKSDTAVFPVNGYDGLLCENWFRMQKDGFTIEYTYKESLCKLVNDTYAWGDWGRHYALLQKYVAEHGTSNIPVKECIVAGVNIAPWVGDQRTAYRKGYLHPDREKLLLNIGFSFNTYTDAWEHSLNLLLEYQKEQGTLNIGKREVYQGERLGLWVQHQRDAYRDGTLSQQRINRLNAVGFDWDPLETEWLRRYVQYQRYVKTNSGNTYISRRTDFEGEHLGAWVETQRKRYTQGKLSQERIEKLQKLGMEL